MGGILYADDLICICKQPSILAVRINANDMHRCNNKSVRVIFRTHGTLMLRAVFMLFSCPWGEKSRYKTV